MDELDPQAALAQALRRKQQAEALMGANQQANELNNLAAIAQMINNPGGAAAAKMASMSRQSQYKPVQMGHQGFMLPSSGEHVESPMFVDEQNAQRLLRRTLGEQTAETARGRVASQEQMAQERLLAQRQLQAERLAAQGREGEANRLLRQSIATMMEGGRNARDNGPAGASGSADKLEANRDKAVVKYTTSLEKAGVPEFDQALTIAEQNLTKYKPGQLPAYGRAMSMVPSALLGDESQAIRTDMQQAANILLKSRSGAAVTDGEMRRFLQEVATGAGMSETALRNGWANVRRAFDAKRQNLTTLLDEEGHAEYSSRGGKDYRMPNTSPQGGLSAAEQAELAELKKKLGKK